MVILYIAITLATVLAMEFVAWSAHKYLMHGLLWIWHEDHHKPHYEKEGFFEKNDLFFLIYAIPAVVLLITGFTISYFPIVYIGIGITS